MNLNYDMATFVDPKIQIAPRELPVEEMMKVGNVLQDRFDKAMENETKTQAFIRKLKSSSNPADHAVADQIMSNYNERLKDRATNGRYQDMQWQTQQDALDVAGMYEGLSNKNKSIQAEISAIMKNDAWKNKDARIKDFMRTVKSANYDTENRMLTGLDVNPFGAAKDVNGGHLALEYGKNAKPFVYAGANGKLVRLDINGRPIPESDRTTKQAYIGHLSTIGDLKILKEEDLAKTLRSNLLEDADMKAMMDRDLKHLYAEAGIDPNNPQQLQAAENIKNEWIKNEIDKPASAVGHLMRQYEDNRKSDVTASQEYKGSGNAWGYGEQQTPQPTKIPDTRNIDNAASPLSKSINETLTDYDKNTDVSYENFKSGKSENAVKNREVINMFTTYLMSKIPELEKSNNDKDKKLLKNINTGAWNTESDNAWVEPGNSGNAFYTAYTKIARGKPETLTPTEYNKIMDLMKDQNISYNYAPKVYNTNDPDYKARNLAEFGTLVLDTNGEYDPLKAINQMNYKVFNNPNGLAIKKTGAWEKGENTALGGASSRGWKYLDPITNSVKDLNTLIDELPNATTNLTVSGIPDPSSLMTANENHREGSNTSYFGNGYVVNFIDKDGKERDIIIGNPSEVNTGNAQVSNLSRFAHGIHGTETVHLKVGNEEMSFKVRGSGKEVVVSSGTQSQKFTPDQYTQWLKNVIQPNKVN